MSDLNAAIDAEMIAHLRGQAEAHLAIAAGLMTRAVADDTDPERAEIAVTRAGAHADFAHGYTTLAAHVASGAINWAKAPRLVTV